MNIAIDGPAGAGKSTIARRVAKEKGYIYVDTGAMYRAIGLYFMNEGVDAENAAAVLEALAAIQVEIKYEAGEQQVYLNGKNVSKKIRQEAVGNMASKVATKQAVRDKLLDLQRNLAAHTGCRDGWQRYRYICIAKCGTENLSDCIGGYKSRQTVQGTCGETYAGGSGRNQA